MAWCTAPFFNLTVIGDFLQVIFVRKSLAKSVLALEYGRWARKAFLSEKCRPEPAVGRHAGMHAFNAAPALIVFDGSAGMTAGNGQGMDHQLGVEVQHLAGNRRRAERSRYGRWSMEASQDA